MAAPGRRRGDLEGQAADSGAPPPPAPDERTPLKLLGEAVSKAVSWKEDDDEEDMREAVSLMASPQRWAESLVTAYSWRLLMMVFVTCHLLKGFVAGGGPEGLVGKPIEFLFGEMQMKASELQILRAAAVSPWALKPVIALLSDAFPIFGYKKRPYVVITTVLACIAAVLIGAGYATSVEALVFCLFLIFLDVSAVDLLVEAKQSEEVKQKPHLSPQFFTFTWVGINIGQFVSVLVLGPLIQYYGPRLPYLIAVPFIAVVLWPTFANFLGERPVAIEERGPNLRVFYKHPVLCAMTIFIGALVLSLLLGTFFMSRKHLVEECIVIAVLVPLSFLLLIRQEIALPVVFFFVCGLLSFDIEGALFYFFTNKPEQYPEGPHFSVYFFTTGLGCASFAGYFIGILTGERLFGETWSYVGIFALTTVVHAVLQLMLVPVLIRSTGGISDHVYVVTLVLVDSVVRAWQWLPKQVIGAHLTPHGMEATMLGLTAGSFNLAMILTSYFGGMLLRYLEVEPAGLPNESDTFKNLWKAQVVSALAPCLSLLFVRFMLPSKPQTESLLEENPHSATHGSPFERQLPAFRQGL